MTEQMKIWILKSLAQGSSINSYTDREYEWFIETMDRSRGGVSVWLEGFKLPSSGKEWPDEVLRVDLKITGCEEGSGDFLYRQHVQRGTDIPVVLVK